MGAFNFKAYNNLAIIRDANVRFEEQLASADSTRAKLFSELAPLFSEAPFAGQYAAFLIHRHYALTDGERMVATDLSTKPSTEVSPNIICERWSSSGEEIEHKFIDHAATHPSPPPPGFFARFGSILKAHGVDILGVCYTPDKLADGFILLENTGPGDREQVLTIVHSSASDIQHSVEAAWIPTLNPNGLSTMSLCSSCTSPDCDPPCTDKFPMTPAYRTYHRVDEPSMLKGGPGCKV